MRGNLPSRGSQAQKAACGPTPAVASVQQGCVVERQREEERLPGPERETEGGVGSGCFGG